MSNIWTPDDTYWRVVAISGQYGPSDADEFPRYHIYNAANEWVASGVTTYYLSGDIDNVTNAAPDVQVISETTTGLMDGMIVRIEDVGGTTAINDTNWIIESTGSISFLLTQEEGYQGPPTFNAPYTSGGTWHSAGNYLIEFSLATYPPGQYTIVVTTLVNGFPGASATMFQVA